MNSSNLYSVYICLLRYRIVGAHIAVADVLPTWMTSKPHYSRRQRGGDARISPDTRAASDEIVLANALDMVRVVLNVSDSMVGYVEHLPSQFPCR